MSEASRNYKAKPTAAIKAPPAAPWDGMDVDPSDGDAGARADDMSAGAPPPKVSKTEYPNLSAHAVLDSPESG